MELTKVKLISKLLSIYQDLKVTTNTSYYDLKHPTGIYILIVDLSVLQIIKPSKYQTTVNDHLTENDDTIHIWIAQSLPDFIQRIYIFDNRLSPVIRHYTVYLDNKQQFIDISLRIPSNQLPEILTFEKTTLDRIIPDTIKNYGTSKNRSNDKDYGAYTK